MIKDDGVWPFGEALLSTGDLDPVYLYLESTKFDYEKRKRWVLGYSMFYHAGVANWLSNFTNERYWQEAHAGIPSAADGGFPRGEERRHFRGETATKAIKFMREYEPEAIVDSWYKETDFISVSKAVQRLPFYGPWISFKLADMGERCLGVPVDFSNCQLGIYKEPLAGAALITHGDPKAPISQTDLQEAIDQLTSYYNDLEYKSPPKFDRDINVQEAETILCKYKSFHGGHYYVGKDINAVNAAVQWRGGWHEIPDLHNQQGTFRPPLSQDY